MTEDRPTIDPRTIRIPLKPTSERKPEPDQIQVPNVPLIASEVAAIQPRAVSNPLRKFSLRGQADEIEARAVLATPLLGKLALKGQATMMYAAPNTGKTLVTLRLCLDAIDAEVIDPDNLYYVNADDSSEGLSVKLRLLQDVGSHMLTPGYNGFRANELAATLIQMVDKNAARDTCVVIDTLKKFTDLMDKRRASDFAVVCRQYVMAGGTIVALGHTTKTGNQDGTPRYQGTTDILDDFDAIYVAQALTLKKGSDHKAALFVRQKGRADSPEQLAYAYATEAGISYAEKLTSVRLVDPDDIDDYTSEIEDVGDPQLMHAIVQIIKAGDEFGQMALAKAAAKACRTSHRNALAVLVRYTGDVPRTHLWNFETRRHGKRVYRLIDQAMPPT